MRTTLALASILVIASSQVPFRAMARELPGVSPGDKIRVTFLPGAKPRQSVLFTKSTTESLSVLGADAEPQTLAWSKIQGVERYEGRRGHAGTGALLGAALGVIAGIAAVSAAPESADTQWEVNKDEALAIAAVGTVVTTGVGALIGAVVRTDRWSNVDLSGADTEWGPEGR
jgi:hypothetical protein